MNAAETPSLRLRSCRPGDGWSWVQKGLKTCGRRPVGFAGLFVFILMSSSLMWGMPIIGPMTVVACIPYFWLVFMAATRRTLQDRPFGPDVFVEITQVDAARRRSLLQVCVLYLLTGIGAMLLAEAVSPWSGEWETVLSADPEQRQALLMQSHLGLDMLIRFTLAMPLTLAFWHAPALIQGLGLGVGKALFFSWMACWHNRWAFAVYGIGWGLVAGAALLGAGALGNLFGSPVAAALLMVPLMVLVGASFYASLYFTTVESFEARLDGRPEAG